MRRKELKSKKGITLIALVVTIVVLLILAGITIKLVFSENGIIKKAQDAAEAQKQAEESDKEALEGLGTQIDILTKWDTSKVTAVKSKDTTPVTVPVPKGFTVSGLSTENTVAGGFVIYEGTDAIDWTDSEKVKEAQKTRNQFVWVPVDLNKNPMFTTATDEDGNTITVGQLYDFETSSSPKNPAEKRTYSSTGYREPDVVKDYDANSTYLSIVGLSSSDEFKKQLQKEFNEMKISIETYGGFYIGRYETGNLEAIKDTAAKVVKGDTKINNVNWYYMYQNSKSIVQNTEAKAAGIKSSMIWGSQWDATMNWFLSFKDTKPEVATYVTDSTGKGNYSGTQGDTNKAIPTGTNDDYAVQNIYDMAGNVWDWTLEASYTGIRVLRRRRLRPFRFSWSIF